MTKKRILSLITMLCMLISIVSLSAHATEEALPEDEPASELVQQQDSGADSGLADIGGKSAILVEPETGAVLFEKNADEQLAAASVTKVMTLLLVVEAIDSGKLNLDDKITASRYAISMGGSQIWLKENEVMTVNELLKATFVASANDAAVALGEAVSGSNDAFIQRMNARAKELGMKNTTYKNATGLDDDGHVTSARDLAIVSSELIKHEMIKDYTLIWMDYLRDGKTELVNTNKLIKSYKGITGLKTGTTSKAGCCLSATAERDGMKMVAVILGADNSADRFSSATKLMDYGFANYDLAAPEISGDMLDPIKVKSGMSQQVRITADVGEKLLVPKGRGKDIAIELNIAPELKAPVTKGMDAGKITLSLDGKVLGEYAVKTAEDAKAVSFWAVISKLFRCVLQP
ncbi:MAG: D-alanyl-D-alanine carboxypeptidase [Oscillospiraceae bacterium]|jgi:D-alanyl-D-alanine carboxypeptidase (penicillin-binding protein 5/6)|nr:D-alanyl-D-alanine carboxypeptidase [Oscillospiraceae bacterium]